MRSDCYGLRVSSWSNENALKFIVVAQFWGYMKHHRTAHEGVGVGHVNYSSVKPLLKTKNKRRQDNTRLDLQELSRLESSHPDWLNL